MGTEPTVADTPIIREVGKVGVGVESFDRGGFGKGSHAEGVKGRVLGAL